jgi:hypothetical protein
VRGETKPALLPFLSCFQTRQAEMASRIRLSAVSRTSVGATALYCPTAVSIRLNSDERQNLPSSE